MEKDTAIVYMVAGISSRFGGKIKQFAKITQTQTLIEYSLDQALKAGFNKIIFIVGNKTEQPFKEKFGNSYKNIPIQYTTQYYNLETRDKPWGTCDALCAIKEIINCPFVVCNGDDIYGEDTFKLLHNHLQNSDEEATIGYKLINVLPETGTTNRGIFEINNENYVTNIKETFNIEKSNLAATNTKPDDLCSMNIFALHPKTVHLLNQQLEQFKQQHQRDRRAECLLPEEISKLIKTNKIKMKIYPTSDRWLGITNPGDEDVVRKELEENLPQNQNQSNQYQ